MSLSEPAEFFSIIYIEHQRCDTLAERNAVFDWEIAIEPEEGILNSYFSILFLKIQKQWNEGPEKWFACSCLTNYLISSAGIQIASLLYCVLYWDSPGDKPPQQGHDPLSLNVSCGNTWEICRPDTCRLTSIHLYKWYTEITLCKIFFFLCDEVFGFLIMFRDLRYNVICFFNFKKGLRPTSYSCCLKCISEPWDNFSYQYFLLVERKLTQSTSGILAKH